MMIAKRLLVLFLCLLSSMATGQWGSDQLLFSGKPKRTRLKSKSEEKIHLKKIQNPDNKILESHNSDSSEFPIFKKMETQFSNENNKEREDFLEVERNPSSLEEFENSKQSLRFYLGVTRLNSENENQYLNFSKQVFSFGAQVSIPFNKINQAYLNYLSTTDMIIKNKGHFKYDDICFIFNQQFESIGSLNYLGIALRQSSMWYSGSTNESKEDTFNSFGINAKTSVKLLEDRKIKTALSIQYYPLISHSSKIVSGSRYGLDFNLNYDLSLGRSLSANMVYEKLIMGDSRLDEQRLTQNYLQFFLGYQLSLQSK